MSPKIGKIILKYAKYFRPFQETQLELFFKENHPPSIRKKRKYVRILQISKMAAVKELAVAIH